MMKKIYISNSWIEINNKARNMLVDLLHNKNFFYSTEYLVEHNLKLLSEDWEKIESKIKDANVVLITADFNSNKNQLIKELDLAKKYQKPIIAVRSYGSIDTSTFAREYANEVVSYNSISIVNAIRQNW